MSRKGLLFAAIAAVLIAGGYYSKDSPLVAKLTASKAAEPVPEVANVVPVISVVTAAPFAFRETVLVSGSIVAREEIMVAPEVEGLKVLELKVDEGAKVKKGDVLAVLERTTLDALVAQNDASLARANAAIAQAKSSIAQAEAAVTEAKNNLERAKPLKQSGYLSGATFDQREAAAKTSQAQLTAARDGLVAAEAEKAQIEALRREIEFRQSRTEVKAPADGIVSRRTGRIGAMALGAADPMFRIIQNGDVELDAEVVETDLVKVRDGQKARVTAAGTDDAEGTVRLVSPEVDKATRLGRVKIFLGNRPELKIGAFARGVIDTNHSRGIGVPATAVTYGTEGAHVQVVNFSKKVERRMVKTGLVADQMIEITSGLTDGDTVVARAGTFLREGDLIRPVAPDEKVSEAK